MRGNPCSIFISMNHVPLRFCFSWISGELCSLYCVKRCEFKTVDLRFRRDKCGHKVRFTALCSRSYTVKEYHVSNAVEWDVTVAQLKRLFHGRNRNVHVTVQSRGTYITLILLIMLLWCCKGTVYPGNTSPLSPHMDIIENTCSQTARQGRPVAQDPTLARELPCTSVFTFDVVLLLRFHARPLGQKLVQSLAARSQTGVFVARARSVHGVWPGVIFLWRQLAYSRPERQMGNSATFSIYHFLSSGF